MSERSISDLFAYLGTPLSNVRWSWGATDGTSVVLRVWQDRLVTIEEGGRKRRFVKITHHDKYMNYEKQGWLERLKHTKAVQEAAPCYLVMCRVKEAEAFNREIEDFNRKEVFVGGRVRSIASEHGDQDELVVELVERIPIDEARARIFAAQEQSEQL